MALKSIKQTEQEWAGERGKNQASAMSDILFNRSGIFDFIGDKEQMWQDATGKVRELLANVPKYQIPQVIKELKNTLSANADEIKAMYGKSADELIGVVDEESKKMGVYEAQTEKGFLGSQNEMLNIYKDIYKGDFGQKILEDKLGAQTAGQVSRLKELGSGSGAALSEVAKLYSGQQEGLRDLAIQVKGYKNEAAQNLALAQERSNTALATIRQNTSANQLARARLQADAVSQGAQMRGAGIQSASDLMTTGATTLAGYQDKQYNINQLTPWASNVDYYSNFANQMSPYTSDYMTKAENQISAQLGYEGASMQSINATNQAQAQ
jgi:hypothetical protein